MLVPLLGSVTGCRAPQSYMPCALQVSVWGRVGQPFPLTAVAGGGVWQNAAGQLDFLRYATAAPPDTFTFTAAARKQPSLNGLPQCATTSAFSARRAGCLDARDCHPASTTWLDPGALCSLLRAHAKSAAVCHGPVATCSTDHTRMPNLALALHGINPPQECTVPTSSASLAGIGCRVARQTRPG